MARRKKPLTAKTANKFVLYQKSVQSPDVDVRFLTRRYKKITGGKLRRFREDFCGTAKLSCEFVKLHRDNQALGVDLDGPTLAWGRKNNLSELTDGQRDRITLLRKNVLSVRRPQVEVIAAMNFSYCVFKTRDALRDYARNARKSLVPGGLFLVDVYGGGQAQEERTEETKKGGFMYIWDQDQFDPVTHDTLCKIHFAFKDGSRLRNAFVYDWRLWTLPELREVFEEAGFRDVHVLWEQTDRDTDEGNGVFRRVERGDADPAWIAYVVGRA